ncbi:MAG TPA: hypothetical protein VIU34_03410 [Steroidobacter sp.]
MNKSKKILCAMFGLHLTAGIVETAASTRAQPQDVAMLFWLPLAVLLFIWCKSDMAERSIDSPPGAAVLVGLLAPVGVPYYFFRALPWQKATTATALALLAFVGMQVTWQLGVAVGELL